MEKRPDLQRIRDLALPAAHRLVGKGIAITEKALRDEILANPPKQLSAAGTAAIQAGITDELAIKLAREVNSRKRPQDSHPKPKSLTAAAIAEAAGDPRPSLRGVLLSGPDLLRLEIPQRPAVLGQWFREGDLGYIFAPRGHGKTWLAMMVGNAVSRGLSMGQWEAGERPRRVVYFDAEMNLPDVQARARLLEINADGFIWLQHEKIFEAFERSLNVMDAGDQEMIGELLVDGDVLVIDNLSTGSSGIEENNNDHFDAIKSWLLKLRNRRVSVIIVHHAGKNGVMRGASRKEDMAHWIISLKDDSSDEGTKAFVTAFDKCRNCEPVNAPPLRWTIVTAVGRFTYTSERFSGPDALLALIRSGIESNSDLAVELGVSKGQVSKWYKRLELRCPPVVEKRGNRYVALEPPTQSE
jgi:hypothetical protein